jgi:hypothetical protein
MSANTMYDKISNEASNVFNSLDSTLCMENSMNEQLLDIFGRANNRYQETHSEYLSTKEELDSLMKIANTCVKVTMGALILALGSLIVFTL